MRKFPASVGHGRWYLVHRGDRLRAEILEMYSKMFITVHEGTAGVPPSTALYLGLSSPAHHWPIFQPIRSFSSTSVIPDTIIHQLT